MYAGNIHKSPWYVTPDIKCMHNMITGFSHTLWEVQRGYKWQIRKATSCSFRKMHSLHSKYILKFMFIFNSNCNTGNIICEEKMVANEKKFKIGAFSPEVLDFNPTVHIQKVIPTIRLTQGNKNPLGGHGLSMPVNLCPLAPCWWGLYLRETGEDRWIIVIVWFTSRTLQQQLAYTPNNNIKLTEYLFLPNLVSFKGIF